jgi:HTH-like domain
MNFSFLKVSGLPEHEGRANLVDCTLISRFSARREACQIMLKMPILRTDDPSSQHRLLCWKKRPASARQIADERLSIRISQVHADTHQVYGSRRLQAELAEQGSSCGRKRVVRLMRKLGLKARHRRRRTATTDSQHSDPVAPNLLDRQWSRLGSQYEMGDGYHGRLGRRGLAVCGSCP